MNEKHDGLLSVTRDGIFIPPEFSPSKLYARLFSADSAEESQSRMREIRMQTSILDFVRDKAKRLERTLGAADRDRLDQYFTSVRELENRLHQAEDWQKREKPHTTAAVPVDIKDTTRDAERAALMYDIAKLALESDSTRLITLYLNPLEVMLNLPGVHDRTHSLTHHGNEPEKLEQLAKIEEAGIKNLGRFLNGLSSVKEIDWTLLDQTMVLFGSNMANGNSHSNTNLPILLAGGGFKHGQHLKFDQKNNTPLCNVYVSMLQRMGIETDKFASSTGTLHGSQRRMNRILTQLICAACVFQIAAMSSGNGAELAPFLKTHCTDCHDAATKKGGLDLESLKFNPDDRTQFETWVRVHDRIQSGEMPPKKSDRPPEADRASILKFLDDNLHDGDARYLAQRGRALFRRLNAQEVENSLKDLLELPDLRIKEILPEDERRHGYNKISEALDLSNVHLAKYMDADRHRAERRHCDPYKAAARV